MCCRLKVRLFSHASPFCMMFWWLAGYKYVYVYLSICFCLILSVPLDNFAWKFVRFFMLLLLLRMSFLILSCIVTVSVSVLFLFFLFWIRVFGRIDAISVDYIQCWFSLYFFFFAFGLFICDETHLNRQTRFRFSYVSLSALVTQRSRTQKLRYENKYS